MFGRAGAAKVIVCLLAILLPAACGHSASSEASPSQATPTRSLGEGDLLLAEIDEEIVQPLAEAFVKGDPDLVPVVADRRADKRQTILDAVARTGDFGVQRLSWSDERTSRPGSFTGITVTPYGTYRIRSVDADIPFSAAIRVDRDEQDRWRIADFTWKIAPPWSGPERIERTATNAALIFHPTSFDPAEMGSLVAEARRVLGRSLPDVRRRTYLVYVAPNRDAYRAAGGGFEAASVRTVRTTTGRDYEHSEPWLMVQLGSWNQASPDSRRTLILHEVTHAILAPYSAPLVPQWVDEGIAVYYSGDLELEIFQREPQYLESKSLRKIAGQAQFFELSGTSTAANYALSGAAFAYLAERFGEAAILDFLKGFGTEMTDAELAGIATAGQWVQAAGDLRAREISVEVTERLLAKDFGTDFDRLEAATKEWIRARI